MTAEAAYLLHLIRCTIHGEQPEELPEGLSAEDAFYAYNILHIAKHYHYGGCGIRRVLDVYYLYRHCDTK